MVLLRDGVNVTNARSHLVLWFYCEIRTSEIREYTPIEIYCIKSTGCDSHKRHNKERPKAHKRYSSRRDRKLTAIGLHSF